MNGTDENAKKKKIIHFLSLPLWLSFVSLFLFLLSFSATPFFSITLSSFFLLLSSPESSPLPFFPFFFFVSLCASVSLFFYFPCHTLYFLFFSPPRPLPLRSAIVVEFGLTDEVNFFFLVVNSMWLWVVVELGWFHVIWVV